MIKWRYMVLREMSYTGEENSGDRAWEKADIGGLRYRCQIILADGVKVNGYLEISPVYAGIGWLKIPMVSDELKKLEKQNRDDLSFLSSEDESRVMVCHRNANFNETWRERIHFSDVHRAQSAGELAGHISEVMGWEIRPLNRKSRQSGT